MRNNINELSKAIRENFNLSNDIFTNLFLEEKLRCVRLEHQPEYFSSLFGTNTEYKKPFDRISDATAYYKQKHKLDNFTKSNELIEKIMNYILSILKSDAQAFKGLSLADRVKLLDHTARFTPFEMSVIKSDGGIESFIGDKKISIDPSLFQKSYNSEFFGETTPVGIVQ